jgi:hypothetical protein
MAAAHIFITIDTCRQLKLLQNEPLFSIIIKIIIQQQNYGINSLKIKQNFFSKKSLDGSILVYKNSYFSIKCFIVKSKIVLLSTYLKLSN